MRSHSEIVQAFGARALKEALAARGVVFSANATQLWAHRNSIPAQYWPDLVEIGAASLDELTRKSVAIQTGTRSEVQEMSRAFVRDHRVVASDEEREKAKRRAAFEAFLAIANQGWRSEEPYGVRDELYER